MNERARRLPHTLNNRSFGAGRLLHHRRKPPAGAHTASPWSPPPGNREARPAAPGQRWSLGADEARSSGARDPGTPLQRPCAWPFPAPRPPCPTVRSRPGSRGGAVSVLTPVFPGAPRRAVSNSPGGAAAAAAPRALRGRWVPSGGRTPRAPAGPCRGGSSRAPPPASQRAGAAERGRPPPARALGGAGCRGPAARGAALEAAPFAAGEAQGRRAVAGPGRELRPGAEPAKTPRRKTPPWPRPQGSGRHKP